MKSLNNQIFENLLKSLECETGSDLETIGFSGKYVNFVLSFHNQIDSDEIIVDECYHELNNVLTHYTLTDSQKKFLLQLVISKVEEIENGIKQEVVSAHREWGSDLDIQVATNAIYN